DTGDRRRPAPEQQPSSPEPAKANRPSAGTPPPGVTSTHSQPTAHPEPPSSSSAPATQTRFRSGRRRPAAHYCPASDGTEASALTQPNRADPTVSPPHTLARSNCKSPPSCATRASG